MAASVAGGDPCFIPSLSFTRIATTRTRTPTSTISHPYWNRYYTRTATSTRTAATRTRTVTMRPPKTSTTPGNTPQQFEAARNRAADRLNTLTDPRWHQMLRLPAKQHTTYAQSCACHENATSATVPSLLRDCLATAASTRTRLSPPSHPLQLPSVTYPFRLLFFKYELRKDQLRLLRSSAHVESSERRQSVARLSSGLWS